VHAVLLLVVGTYGFAKWARLEHLTRVEYKAYCKEEREMRERKGGGRGGRSTLLMLG
jgi:hypothetical protein